MALVERLEPDVASDEDDRFGASHGTSAAVDDGGLDPA